MLWDRRKRLAFLAAVGMAVSLLILASVMAWAVAFHIMWAAFDRPSDRLASAAPSTVLLEVAPRP